MVDVKQVADAADMIVNGYAFTRCAEGFRVLMVRFWRPAWMILRFGSRETFHFKSGKS